MMTAAALNERLAHAAYPDILGITVLDPACGAGAFLVEAYRVLLAAAQRALRKPLTQRQKLEVLRSCIFGADVDRHALEAAAHSLSHAAGRPHTASLHRNLVRGNALLDEIFSARGFDAVLANPPYVFGEHLSGRDKSRVKARYHASGEQIDLYAAFLELAVTRLCKPHGVYAFIVPDAILVREQRSDVRKILLEHAPPHAIAHVGAVFAEDRARVSAAVLVGRRGIQVDRIRVVAESPQGTWETVNELPLAQVRNDALNRFLIYVRPEEWRVFEALRKVPRLESVLAAGAHAKGVSRGEEAGKCNLPAKRSRTSAVPAIAGDAITPYALAGNRYFLKSLKKNPRCYTAPKILVRKTDDRLFACAEYEGTATLQSVYNLQVEPEKFDCVLAVLNSKFARWFLKRTVTQYKQLMPQITQTELLSLPIPASSRDYSQLVKNAAENGAHLEALEAAVLQDLGVEQIFSSRLQASLNCRAYTGCMPALHEGPVTISLHGDYDISSNEALRRLLSTAEEADEAVIDLSDVTYAGTTLLNALLNLRSRMRAHGSVGIVRLTGGSKQLRKVLEVTRLDRVFNVM